jgi:hypothetical protein
MGVAGAGDGPEAGRSSGIDSVPIGPPGAPWITTDPRINPQFEQLMPDSSFMVEQRAHFQLAMVRVPSLGTTRYSVEGRSQPIQMGQRGTAVRQGRVKSRLGPG